MEKKTYKDKFGHAAEIELQKRFPHKGSPVKEPAYILSCYDDYDEDDFMYFRSVYPTLEDALRKLSEFSCGTFEEV